jgi:hypothetical protein
VSDKFILAIIHDIDSTQEALILAAVKEKATAYWHQYPDVWVMQGSASAFDWFQTLRVFVPNSPSSLVVFELPGDGARRWGALGPKHNWSWLENNYASPSGGPPRPADPWGAPAPTSKDPWSAPGAGTDEPPF